MSNVLLNNYNLSFGEVIQSLFVSEYGLRHLEQAKIQTECEWGHRIIAVIELCPLLGFIVSIIEALIASILQSDNSDSPFQFTPSDQTSPIKNRVWLVKGSQSECCGSVSIAKVESIRSKLEIHHTAGIQFNQKKVVDNVVGGTCTAMSLEFLDSYLKAEKISKENANEQSDMLLKHLINIGQKLSSSSEEMRNRQAAYNTIEVTTENNAIDYSKNKIQSLANFHSLEINYSSSEIDIEKLNNENELSKEIDVLQEGAFLIRILKPANNEKLEEEGHSLVYIKEHGLGFFYDPNFGVIDIPSLEHSKILFKGLTSCFHSFGISKARFYRFQPAA